MKVTQLLHNLGRSIWLPNSARDLLNTGMFGVIASTAGIDVDALPARLQDEDAKAFVKSWHELMGVIASKSAAPAKAS